MNTANLTKLVEDSDIGAGTDTEDSGIATLAAGDTLTFSVTHNFGHNGGSATITVLSSPGGVDDGKNVTVATGATGNLQVTAAGAYTFRYVFAAVLGQTTNATVSATCVAGVVGGAGSSASDSASGADSEVRTGDAGRLPTTPADLPDAGSSQSPVFDAEQSRLATKLNAVEQEIQELREDSRTLIEGLRQQLATAFQLLEPGYPIQEANLLGDYFAESLFSRGNRFIANWQVLVSFGPYSTPEFEDRINDLVLNTAVARGQLGK